MNQTSHRPHPGILLLIVAALTGEGCTSLRTLEPALETNEQNISDITATSNADAELVERAGDAIFEQAIISRRAATAQELASIGIALQGQNGDMAKWAATGADPLANQFRMLQQAWPGASEDAKKTIRKAHPVLIAMIELDVTPTQVAADAAWIAQNGKDNPVVSQELLKKYPGVKEMIDSQTKFDAAWKLRRETLSKQTALACAHANLFVFAAKTRASNQQVLASILGDPELRSEALGLIKNEKAKTSAGEGLDLLVGILNDKPK